MQQGKLKEKLKDKTKFIIVAELTGGPGYNFGPIEKFLKSWQSCDKSVIPQGFCFAGITSPQNPGGVANINPADVLSQLMLKELLGELDFIPHISCKDENVDAIVSSLVGFRKAGIESILALTGDKPIKAKGVFELDSLGLLQMISSMNNEAYIKAKVDQLDSVHQYFTGAAVSPFKYTEPSLMQQYYKMEKKIRCGAEFFITQVGWDWKKSLELFRYTEENNLDVPVIGNVYFLSTMTPAPRLMHDIKLPGCSQCTRRAVLRALISGVFMISRCL